LLRAFIVPMGHHEQIGIDNTRYRAERAQLPRWRRFDWLGLVALIVSLGLWLILIPVLWHGVQLMARLFG
jgi:hypothetical protein